MVKLNALSISLDDDDQSTNFKFQIRNYKSWKNIKLGDSSLPKSFLHINIDYSYRVALTKGSELIYKPNIYYLSQKNEQTSILEELIMHYQFP